MNTDEQKIDRYLSKEMTLEEKNSFESEIKENAELQREVVKYKTAVRAVRNHELMQEMKAIHKEVAAKEGYGSGNKFYYISGIAASFVLIFAMTYMFYFNTSIPSGKLYTSYFEPYPNLNKTSRGSEDQLKEALAFYSSGQYDKALSELKLIPKESHDEEKIIFYSSMSLMMLEKNKEAIEMLNSLPSGSIYEQQINWYLGLAYLKEGNKEETRKHLSKIKEREFKYNQAQTILESL